MERGRKKGERKTFLEGPPFLFLVLVYQRTNPSLVHTHIAFSWQDLLWFTKSEITVNRTVDCWQNKHCL